jgi:hypothetical protein
VERHERFDDHFTIDTRRVKLDEMRTHNKYGTTLSLLAETRFVFLHETGNGIVFCTVVYSEAHARQHDFAWDGKAYIHVSLICANGGVRGMELLTKVFQLAHILKIDRVALSVLSHAVWYYYNAGFRFADDSLDEVALGPRFLDEYHDGLQPLLLPMSKRQMKEAIETHREYWQRSRKARTWKPRPSRDPLYY